MAAMTHRPACMALIITLGTLTLGQEVPLNFSYDKIDGRLVWIQNRTNETAQKIEYRLLTRDPAKGLKAINSTWQQLSYDPRSPIWQKPDGICGEYELSVTTSDWKNYLQALEAPAVTLKAASKLRPLRIFYDPIRNRVMVELTWGNDFDHWTAAGAVLIQTTPWAKLITCQSLFKGVAPPPSLENGLTMWSFDPEYARNNCTFIFGLNGTLQMMQTPLLNRGSTQLMQVPLVTDPIFQPEFNPRPAAVQPVPSLGQGQPIPHLGPPPEQIASAAFPIRQAPLNVPVVQQAPTNVLLVQQPNGQVVQIPIKARPVVRQSRSSNPQNYQAVNPTQRVACDIVNYSSSISNESLPLNLSCETVSGSSAFCIQPQRQCSLDCSPIDIRAYNMQDNGEYLKIEWRFPDVIQRGVRRYQVRYAEANVTPWNTVYSEKEAAEMTAGANESYVEIRNFSAGSGQPTNFTFQVCANLGDFCNAAIKWEQEWKYAIGYAPKPSVSANLVFSESRRRGKATSGAAIVYNCNVACVLLWMSLFVSYDLFVR